MFWSLEMTSPSGDRRRFLLGWEDDGAVGLGFDNEGRDFRTYVFELNLLPAEVLFEDREDPAFVAGIDEKTDAECELEDDLCAIVLVAAKYDLTPRTPLSNIHSTLSQST
jgi:hypothetical protein